MARMLNGTLDMMILRTLAAGDAHGRTIGDRHRFGTSRQRTRHDANACKVGFSVNCPSAQREGEVTHNPVFQQAESPEAKIV
jgi:hypothetical protein